MVSVSRGAGVCDKADVAQEAKTATINMNDDDPQTLKRMLFYLYNLDYPDHEVPDIHAEHVGTGRLSPPHLKIPTSIDEATIVSANLESSEGAPTHDPRMMNNVLVYAIAEKYDIPDLKALANGKFQSLARSKWPHDDFYILTEAVFSTTPDNDMGLRQVVLDICEKHFQDILRSEDRGAGILGIPAIGAVVLGAAVRKFDQDKILLDDATEISKIEANATLQKSEELLLVQANLERACEEKKNWRSGLANLFDYDARKTDKCRFCKGEIKCYGDRFGFGRFKLELRCTGRCLGIRTIELLI